MNAPAHLLQAEPYVRAAAAPAAAATLRGRAADIAIAVHGELPPVEAAWRAFQDAADCTAFQSFEWLSAWQRHVGAPAGVAPQIVVARDQGGVLAMLPLAVVRRGLLRELTWLGSDLCDYNAPLLAPDFARRLDAAAFAALWRRVLEAIAARAPFDIVRLEKMPAAVGAQANPMTALAVTLNPSGCYATALGADFQSFYEAKRSSATRARDRSKRKRLAACGDIAFVTAADAASANAVLDVLMTQKAAAFAKRGIGNIFARPGYAEFYRALAAAAPARDLVHVSALKVGQETAAANFALTFKGRYYYVLSSYTDGDMARFGPGAAHLHELFRYAIERGCTVFDFTIGDEPYKRDWCERADPLYDHVAVTTWRGALAAARLTARAAIKRAIKQNPLLWAAFSRARAAAGLLRRA